MRGHGDPRPGLQGHGTAAATNRSDSCYLGAMNGSMHMLPFHVTDCVHVYGSTLRGGGVEQDGQRLVEGQALAKALCGIDLAYFSGGMAHRSDVKAWSAGQLPRVEWAGGVEELPTVWNAVRVTDGKRTTDGFPFWTLLQERSANEGHPWAKRLTAKANQGPEECGRADRTLAAGSYSSVVCSIMRDERRLGGGVFWMPHVWIRVCLKQGLERHMQLVVKASRRITAHHDSWTQSSAAPQAIAYTWRLASRGCFGIFTRLRMPVSSRISKAQRLPPDKVPFYPLFLGPPSKILQPRRLVGVSSVQSSPAQPGGGRATVRRKAPKPGPAYAALSFGTTRLSWVGQRAGHAGALGGEKESKTPQKAHEEQTVGAVASASWDRKGAPCDGRVGGSAANGPGLPGFDGAPSMANRFVNRAGTFYAAPQGQSWTAGDATYNAVYTAIISSAPSARKSSRKLAPKLIPRIRYHNPPNVGPETLTRRLHPSSVNRHPSRGSAVRLAEEPLSERACPWRPGSPAAAQIPRRSVSQHLTSRFFWVCVTPLMMPSSASQAPPAQWTVRYDYNDCIHTSWYRSYTPALLSIGETAFFCLYSARRRRHVAQTPAKEPTHAPPGRKRAPAAVTVASAGTHLSVARACRYCPTFPCHLTSYPGFRRGAWARASWHGVVPPGTQSLRFSGRDDDDDGNRADGVGKKKLDPDLYRVPPRGSRLASPRLASPSEAHREPAPGGDIRERLVPPVFTP
ncbi:hypothetical protein PCL_05091 [Purpureocillium lilacinum]|uniref:Uncharacterized protein n=1 Tax=Purpureocillium lilacinum TaxID=33203 RepID=A0A2U3DVW0_PURLI|nr:hypothetical protein PCL_05091 [Purpureocillium lilacinum]